MVIDLNAKVPSSRLEVTAWRPAKAAEELTDTDMLEGPGAARSQAVCLWMIDVSQ